MTDHVDDLLVKLIAARRDEALAKCGAAEDDETSGVTDPCMLRAKRVFIRGVRASGGNRKVAANSGGIVDESAIRQMRQHPKRPPSLVVVYAGLDPDEMDRVADDIKAAAQEKRGVRRAG